MKYQIFPVGANGSELHPVTVTAGSITMAVREFSKPRWKWCYKAKYGKTWKNLGHKKGNPRKSRYFIDERRNKLLVIPKG